MSLDHVDDPVEADKDLCRRQEDGRELQSRFGARRRPYRSDIADLLGAIAKDPGYARPPKKLASPKPKPQPATLLERIRAAREAPRTVGPDSFPSEADHGELFSRSSRYCAVAAFERLLGRRDGSSASSRAW
jgi:hypothetical protein